MNLSIFPPFSNSTQPASAVFVVLAGLLAWLAGSPALALYALSFWHYLLYALAYRYGAVPLAAFKRDAVLMKSVSLLVLACAYLTAAPDFASLAVVATGFLLNLLAASVLGSDRTYYGHEVANLPPLRVTRFPFSLISHPMLVGNMLGYGGTLLNAEFRAQWWPLACVHVALNLALLVMEQRVRPLRLNGDIEHGTAADGGHRSRWIWPRALALCVGGAMLGIGAAQTGGSLPVPVAAALGAAVAVYGHVIYCAYTHPAPSAECGALVEPGKSP